jgi:hypothetical protein
MATSNRLSHRRFETIANDRPLAPAELAALDIAARPLSKCRGELATGDHKVWVKVLISGGLTVREPVTAATPADVLGVIAWILARLPDKARVSVAAAVSAGETLATGKAERDAAKALCEPTRGSTVRSGAISGTIAVDIVR